MPCYSYSSNEPVYLEPNAAPFSIEVEYTSLGGSTYSYAGIARLCEIEAKDQLCVYTLVGATETLRTLGTHYTVNTSPETITYSASLTGIDKLIIRRCTPNNKMLISFAEGAKLSAKQLNLVTHQLLFIAQEKQFKDANITHVYPLATSYGTPTAWNSGTTYGLNAYVVYNSIVYQSLQAGNTNNNPATQTAWWNPIEFLTKGFVIQNASQPVVIDLNGIAPNEALVWNGTKFTGEIPSSTASIPAGSITSAQLNSTTGAVATGNIQNLAVTGAKIAAGTIDATKLTTGKPSWTTTEVTIPAALVVTTSATIGSTLTVGSGLTVTTGGLTLSNGNLTVSGSGTNTITGNTTITGNLTVSGTLTSSTGVLYPAVSTTVYDQSINYTLNNTRNSAVEISALRTSITTKRNASKVRVTFVVQFETVSNMAFILERGSGATPSSWTELGTPQSPGNRLHGIAVSPHDGNDDSTQTRVNIEFLDTPGNAGVYTYRLKGYATAASQIFYLNSTINATDSGNYERGTSVVILQEIFMEIV
jgi:phage baseplate assembly protein gpV